MALSIYYNGLPFNADTDTAPDLDVDGVVQFALRCDAGEKTSEPLSVAAPMGCTVSADGSTYGATATYAADAIQDSNVPLYVKRTESGLTEATVRKSVATPRLALVDTEPMSVPNNAPLAFTPTVTGVSDTSATVTFSTTDPDGDAIIYTVAITTSATPPASGWVTATSPYTRSTLSQTTTYYAHVRASDGTLTTVGTSAMFTTAAAADTTAPTIAGTLVATVNGTTQVTLSGVTASDENGIAKWQRRVNSDAWVDVASTSTTFPATAVGGLTPDTSYTFDVRAVDPSGNPSAVKTASAKTEAAAANQPPAAFTPTATPGETSATIAFSTTDPDGDPLTYRVAVTTSETPPADWSGYPDVTSPHTATGLTAETAYHAHVRASDGNGGFRIGSASFTTTASQGSTELADGTYYFMPDGTISTTAPARQNMPGSFTPDAAPIARIRFGTGSTWWDMQSVHDIPSAKPITITVPTDGASSSSSSSSADVHSVWVVHQFGGTIPAGKTVQVAWEEYEEEDESGSWLMVGPNSYMVVGS